MFSNILIDFFWFKKNMYLIENFCKKKKLFDVKKYKKICSASEFIHNFVTY